MASCSSCLIPMVDEPGAASGSLRCPRCGRRSAPPVGAANPFATPAADLMVDLAPFAVPRGFAARLHLAIALYLGELPRIAAILLLCYLPVALGSSVLIMTGSTVFPMWGFRLAFQGLYFVFVTLAMGAILNLLAERVEGRRPRLLQALREGFGCWARLLLARVFAGLLVGLGLILFVVPGLVSWGRLVLTGSAVVLEEERPVDSLRRSAELVRGRAWPTFVQFAMVWLTLALFSFLVDLGLTVVGGVYRLDALTRASLSIGNQAILVVAHGIPIVWQFVTYWDYREHPVAPSPPPEFTFEPEGTEPNFGL